MGNQADSGNQKELRDLNAQAMELMMALARAEGRIEGVTLAVEVLRETTRIADMAQPVRKMGEEMMKLSNALLDLAKRHDADLSADSMRLLDILIAHHKATHD